MKLSIIIPVYNEEPFLRRCLDSVYATKDVEIIVIEDGSTDGSKDICARYADKYCIKYHLTNWGVSISRNDGLYTATGDFVTFLDSDDEMSPDGIETMLKAIDNHASENVIQFNHFRKYADRPTLYVKYTNPTGYYPIEHKPLCWCMVWNKLYKRQFLIDNGISFVNRLQYGEDEIFNLAAYRAGIDILCIAENTIIKHFENQESICHTLNQDKLIKQTRALLDFLEECDDLRMKAALRELIASHWDSDTYKVHIGNYLQIESK